MAKIRPTDVMTAVGRPVRLRSAVPGDARAYLHFMDRCLARSDYLIQTAEEIRPHVSEQRALLRRIVPSPSDMLLLAHAGGTILGSLDAVTDRRRRLAHVSTIGVMVDPDWRGQGVGSALLTTFMEWAQTHSALEKVELHVHSENERAQALYRRFGFIEEGRRRKAIKYDDSTYMDDVLMGLDLTAWAGYGLARRA